MAGIVHICICVGASAGDIQGTMVWGRSNSIDCANVWTDALFYKIQKNSVLVSAAALVLTLNGMPSIVQGLYWFNGAWNYIPFFYLTLFNLALLIRYEFEKIPQKRWLIGSVLLSFLISGGNHVTGFLNIMLLSLGGGSFKTEKTTALSVGFGNIGVLYYGIRSRYSSPTEFFSKADCDRNTPGSIY